MNIKNISKIGSVDNSQECHPERSEGSSCDVTPIRRALISVSHKEGLIDFAKGLAELNIEILSTGGTSKLLREANIPVKDVADVTQFPEMMDGRVKTLHPKIHGGILGLRDTHSEIAKQHGIDWIDLVVVNLYPFAETIKKPNVTFAEAIENIDIGGPAMIRSAAKNMQWTTVIVDPANYSSVLTELQTQRGLSASTRRQLATKAFAHTAEYDALIHHFFSNQAVQAFPESLQLNLKKFGDLRYGENPHQAAAAYQIPEENGILSAKIHQGKPLSYNNIADADAALACLREFSEPACVIVKHANPCGVATAENIDDAFQRAYHADSQSAFGGIIALNRCCTREIAKIINTFFVEVLIAPAYELDALQVFAKKPNLRVLELSNSVVDSNLEFKFITGGLLVQDKDHAIINADQLKIVTQRHPLPNEINSMLFAWRVLKHIKSNAILIAKDQTTMGIGAGQVSRIDAVRIAIEKAGKDLTETVLASDAFFPFRDSIDHIAKTGIKAIIQPGGSLRDQEVIDACNENGIAMVFTGVRCFKH